MAACRFARTRATETTIGAQRLRRVAAALAVAMAATLASSCTSGPPATDGGPSASPTAPGTASPPASTPAATSTPTPATRSALRWGLGDDPTAIDPRFAEDEEGLLVVDALFDSLTRLDQDLRAAPSAAASWEVDDESRTWTFTLADGQRFHDGTPVTADDFRRAFVRIVDGTASPRSFLAHLLRDVRGWEQAQQDGTPLAGVTVLDDGRLRVELARPDAEFAEVLAHPALGPVPPGADEDLRAFGESPVGNGPFQMAEPWAHNQFIRLVPADDRALLGEVLFRIYADDPGAGQQYADFTAGQLQVASVPPQERRRALTALGSGGDTGPGLLDGPRATTYNLGFNTTLAPFDDPVVRRAVSLLVDREAIAAEVMLDTRHPAASILPSGLAGARANTCALCRYDPALAVQLLEEAGIVLDPEQVGPIRFLHNTGATHAQVAERIADQLREHLGLEVEVVALDLAAFAEQVLAGRAHLFRHGWTAEHGSAGSTLVPLFHSRSLGEDNVFGFSDPEVDELLDGARATPDRGERLAAWFRAEDRLALLLPLTPILAYEHGLVVAPGVEGFRMDALGRVDLASIRRVDG